MKVVYLLVLCCVLCAACSNEREAPNGLKVKVLRTGEGNFAKPGEFLIASMVIKDSKDSVWRDTRKQGMPLIIPIGDASQIELEKGVESTFRVMKKGDSCHITVTLKTLFNEEPIPPNLKPEDLMTLVFSVSDITDQRGVSAIQEQIQAKQNASSRNVSENQLMLDTVAIDAYLEQKKIVAIKHISGLRYVIKKLGKGPKPNLSNTVTVTYKGSFMEGGEVFDQSNGPVVYPLNIFIEGWKIGFQLLPKGTAATLFIPSTLAYGPGGSPPRIPPNANLVFEVELIDFK